MDICKGSLVYSRAGRDKGGLFLVLSAEENHAYIADGNTRKISAPKRKNVRHLNKTNTVLDMDFENLSDSQLRKALEKY